MKIKNRFVPRIYLNLVYTISAGNVVDNTKAEVKFDKKGA
jgi:hypothetical protein